jgi:hypothetical protein
LVLGFVGITSIDQIKDSTVRINWSSHSNATSYKIYHISGGSPSLLQTVSAPSSSVVLTSLISNTSYIFRVTAVDANGLTDTNQNDQSVTTALAPEAPTGISLISSASLDTPVIRVSGVKNGDIVKLYKDSSCILANLIGTATATSSTVDISTSSLAMAAYTIYANSTNAQGTASACSTPSLAYTVTQCPTGYEIVPANGGLGVNLFCVMKYEAKNVSNVPVSQPANSPWASISVTNAKTACTSLGSKYDLISNPEWMTIARDAENVSTNWSGGSVGSGMLPIGNSDGTPLNSLSVTNTADPYNQTGNNNTQSWGVDIFAPHGGEQRRIINLSNGSVIWDFSGNIEEWVDWNIAPGYQGSPTTCSTGWSNIQLQGVNCTGLTAADYSPTQTTYTSANGIGKFLFESTAGQGTIIRGGSYSDGIDGPVGIFNLGIWYSSLTGAESNIGFRCVYRP